MIGAVARASETYLMPAFINKMFGTNFQIVTGYQAAGKINLAIESGETDAAITTWNDVTNYHPDWLAEGKMRLIMQIALEKHPDLANVPLLLDYAQNQANHDLIAFMSSGSMMGQSYAAPPGVPAPVVEALRRAFDETMKDPDFIAKMQSAKMAFNPLSGEELTKFVPPAAFSSAEPNTLSRRMSSSSCTASAGAEPSSLASTSRGLARKVAVSIILAPKKT